MKAETRSKAEADKLRFVFSRKVRAETDSPRTG